jgi:hypothetical protein
MDFVICIQDDWMAWHYAVLRCYPNRKPQNDRLERLSVFVLLFAAFHSKSKKWSFRKV